MFLADRLFGKFKEMASGRSSQALTPEQEDVVGRELRARHARLNADDLRAEFEPLLRSYQQGPHQAPLLDPREPE